MARRGQFACHLERRKRSAFPAILAALAAIALLVAAAPDSRAQDALRAEVETYRQKRDTLLRSDPFSPLTLVHREYLDGRTFLTIGDCSGYDLQLPVPTGGRVHVFFSARGIKTVQKDPLDPSLENMGIAEFQDARTIQIGKYHLLFRPDAPVRGAAIEVYDTEELALKEFRGLEFFPIDARYRVQAELTPRAESPQVQLIDSAGQSRPYFIYGDLRFTLDSQPVTMEVYTPTLDPAAIKRSGFMLIFADATSGKESYYAARYLDIEGKRSGSVTVDFNLARNPPCAFSPVFTCPFPRPQNRLAVAIRAGEKAYHGKTATPLKK